MASELLKKMRLLNKILQKKGAEPVIFEDICNTLSHVLECNVYIISRKAKILGYTFNNGVECESVKQTVLVDKKFPEYLNNKLLSINDTLFNVENYGKSSFDETQPAEIEGKLSTIIPIIGNRDRLGTLYLTRFETKFDDNDLVLAEYSATIVGLEILRSQNDLLEEEARKKAVVQLALGTLSYSELEAVEHVFNELNGSEGLLVASKIADKVGITRSVIVNALRKFESAGVIESRSLGMKGTHIKILNDKLIDELKKIR
ncbi:GTP-sensing pleiotropic transcriptional regulator CodY [Clostridium grantii]|uniref:Global transcriptional regulator CodY n=1 Tax=Clostridium grantii DSM 8605 TaxID=1121316 RepID=A0A1M5QWZ3_9CLOT|nr:GTP-sensing pleiotropic transcriptional regulator CodY [Clostridium grantii]SHH18239.1 transcriptional pleiotropic repressor [Clostridium grantii DSM 8605]